LSYRDLPPHFSWRQSRERLTVPVKLHERIVQDAENPEISPGRTDPELAGDCWRWRNHPEPRELVRSFPLKPLHGTAEMPHTFDPDVCHQGCTKNHERADQAWPMPEMLHITPLLSDPCCKLDRLERFSPAGHVRAPGSGFFRAFAL